MNPITLLSFSNWAEQIGWTLLHSLWQIALLALIYAIAAHLMRKNSASARYLLGCVLFGLMLILPVFTLTLIHQQNLPLQTEAPPAPGLPIDHPIILEQNPTEMQTEVAELVLSERPRTAADSPMESAAVPLKSEPLNRSWDLRPWLPRLTLFWLIGALCFSLRPIWGWMHIQRLKHRGTSPLGNQFQQLGEHLANRLGVKKAVRFLESSFVEVPTVIGYLRPVVLLPATVVTGLSVKEIELILAHELAHVRRYDYLVNLVQTVIETNLFYHPAMWWLSKQIRQERENCCDDMVVALDGNRVAYIQALAQLEQNRQLTPATAMTANGGSLLQRVRRLLGQPNQEFGYYKASSCFAGLMTLCLMLSIVYPAFLPGEEDTETTHEFSEAIADRFALILDISPLPERQQTEQQKLILRNEYRNFFQEQPIEQLSQERREAILESFDRIVKKHQLAFEEKQNQPLDIYDRNQEYVSLPDHLKTLKWKVYKAINQGPLNQSESERLQTQRMFLADHIKSLTENREGQRQQQLELLQAQFNDPLDPLFQTPMTDEQFTTFMKRFPRRPEDRDLDQVVTRLRQKMLSIKFEKDEALGLPGIDAVWMRDDIGHGIELRFLSNTPFNGFHYGLTDIDQHYSVCDTATGTWVSAPGNILTRDGFDQWIKQQDKGDFGYDDANVGELFAVRGTKMAVLDVEDWMEADAIDDASLRAEILNQDRNTISLKDDYTASNAVDGDWRKFNGSYIGMLTSNDELVVVHISPLSNIEFGEIGTYIRPRSKKIYSGGVELALDITKPNRTESQTATEVNQTSDAKKTGPTLRGRITDEGGTPIPDVEVSLYKRFPTWEKGQTTKTNSKGEYQFTPVDTGEKGRPFESRSIRKISTEIRFSHSEYVPADGQLRREIAIPYIDQYQEVYNAIMSKGGKISGTVIDHKTGEPNPDLKLSLFNNFFTDKSESTYFTRITTDSHGNFISPPLFPGRYAIAMVKSNNDNERFPIIGSAVVTSNETSQVQITTADKPIYQNPFQITGKAVLSNGQPLQHDNELGGYLDVRMKDSENQLRLENYRGAFWEDTFKLNFGPIERTQPSENSPYGVGTHDIILSGTNLRYGYKLIERTPSEPLRITDDPNQPELENGIRYIHPNRPIEFKLVLAENNPKDIGKQENQRRTRSFESEIFLPKNLKLDGSPEAVAKRAEWSEKLLKLTNHNQTFMTVGPLMLFELSPDEAFEVVREVWPKLKTVQIKRGLLKTFEFARHPRVLDVLDLGARDSSVDVEHTAYTYLENYAFRKFAHSKKYYLLWRQQYVNKPVEVVLQENARWYVQNLKNYIPHFDSAFQVGVTGSLANINLTRDLNLRGRKSSYPSKAKYLKEAGLIEVLKTWPDKPQPTMMSREQATKLIGKVETLAAQYEESLKKAKLAESSNPIPESASKAVREWSVKVQRLTNHNVTAFAVGPKMLQELSADEAYEVVRLNWSFIQNNQVKTGLLKTFEFSRHARVLEVLNLGALDETKEVHNYAFSYLKNYAFRDFSKPEFDYKPWNAKHASQPVDQVLQDNAKWLVEHLRKQGPINYDRWWDDFIYMLNLSGTKSSYPKKARYLKEAGLIDLLQQWHDAQGAHRETKEGALRLIKKLDGLSSDKRVSQNKLKSSPPKLIWGPESQGLKAAIVLLAPEEVKGEPSIKPGVPIGTKVEVRFHVKNVSQKVITFESPTHRQGDQKQIKESDTGKVLDSGTTQRTGIERKKRWRLKPGDSAELQVLDPALDQIELAGQYSLSYQFQLTHDPTLVLEDEVSTFKVEDYIPANKNRVEQQKTMKLEYNLVTGETPLHLHELKTEKAENARWNNPDQQGADLQNVNVAGGFKSFSGTNFTEADLSDSTWIGEAAFQKALFHKANLTNASLNAGVSGFQFAEFENALLRNAQLTGGGSSFQYASFKNADLTGAHLEGTAAAFQLSNFDDARLIQTKIICGDYSDFQGASLNNTDFSGADISSIDPRSLESCKFNRKTPPKYSKETQLPKGFKPKTHGWKLINSKPDKKTSQRTNKEQAPANLNWGPVHKGLQAAVELRAQEGVPGNPSLKPGVPVGTKVDIFFHIKNVSQETITFHDGKRQEGHQVFTTNAAGEQIEVKKVFYMSWNPLVKYELKPQETITMAAPGALFEKLNVADEYQVQFTIYITSHTKIDLSGERFPFSKEVNKKYNKANKNVKLLYELKTGKTPLVLHGVESEEVVQLKPEVDQTMPENTNPEAVENQTTIKGTITAPDGQPAVGAKVAVVRYLGYDAKPRNKLLGETVTDSAGKYEIHMAGYPSLENTRANLVARTENSGLAVQEVDLVQKQSTVDLNLQDQQLIQLRLIDSNQEPVGGLPVELAYIALAGKKRGPQVSLGKIDAFPEAGVPALITDASGLLTIPNIASGFAVHLEIAGSDQFAPQRMMLNSGIPEKRGAYDGTYRPHIRNIKPNEVAELQLHPARIFTGKVLLGETGKPAANARISMWASDQKMGSMVAVESKTDADGNFRINPYPGIRYGIHAYPPAGEPFSTTQLDQLEWKPGEPTNQYEIKLKRCAMVRGTIVDARSGKPLAEASIQYEPQAENNKNKTDDSLTGWQGIQKTNSQGEFAIPVLPGPGTLLVHAKERHYILQEMGGNELYRGKPGGVRNYAHAFKTINPEKDEIIDDVKFELRPGTSISGTVVTEQGKPVEKAIIISRLKILAINPTWRSYGNSQDLTREGSFELTGLEPGKDYKISILDAENKLGATVTLNSDTPDPQIVLKPCGSAKTRFIDPEGNPIAGKPIGMLWMVITPGVPQYSKKSWKQGFKSADEDLIANVDQFNHRDIPLTNENGELFFPALIPGAHYRHLNHDDDGSHYVEEEFIAQSGKKHDLGDIVVKLRE